MALPAYRRAHPAPSPRTPSSLASSASTSSRASSAQREKPPVNQEDLQAQLDDALAQLAHLKTADKSARKGRERNFMPFDRVPRRAPPTRPKAPRASGHDRQARHDDQFQHRAYSEPRRSSSGIRSARRAAGGFTLAMLGLAAATCLTPAGPVFFAAALVGAPLYFGLRFVDSTRRTYNSPVPY
jgi:hypothetical protein